ncbi:MAG TPA: glycosyltransferase, partial [Gemmatimonadaceae bacterium]|nr:glycosyltransferase [Gemmatimonadaceae bacterium]
MARTVEAASTLRLDDYAADATLAAPVAALRRTASRTNGQLRDQRIWNVNSTATGGGVAELLPTQLGILRELGVDARWAVIETDRVEFFALTKTLHNMIHGAAPDAPLGARDREVYDAVSRANADALARFITPGDIVVIHDPQPLGAGALLKQMLGVRIVWRCHIGLDTPSVHANDAWAFLRPYAEQYDHAVFTAREYVPSFLADRATIIHPTIDPLSHKNRGLSLHKLVGVLCDSELAVAHWPLITPPFPEPAMRLQPDGSFAPATKPEDLGLIARPIISQISRWDRLKGFVPLLDAFRVMKQRRGDRAPRDDRHRLRLDAARLVLAGPEAAGVKDDPEALEVLAELKERYFALEPDIQKDVAILNLPMRRRKENALMVNALQRCSDVVAQNSLREGFGLTVAEAMWKRKPVLGSATAFGVRQQVRDHVDGRLVADPEDRESLALVMSEMLADSNELEEMGRSAERRAHDEFLVFRELEKW